jgi:hypothetical protein
MHNKMGPKRNGRESGTGEIRKKNAFQAELDTLERCRQWLNGEDRTENIRLQSFDCVDGFHG